MAKKIIQVTRKVNKKEMAKNEVMAVIQQALKDSKLEYKDGVDYGMTKGTIIVSHKNADIQIKPISPKAGIDRYKEVIFEYVDK